MADTAPRNPAGPLPVRRPGSVRRTSTLDTSWPDGLGQPTLMRGHARDVRTAVDDPHPLVLDECQVEIEIGVARDIRAITGPAHGPDLQHFVGARGGGHSRSILAETLSSERDASSGLHLLLDDFAGASLVSGWVWSRWIPDWTTKMREAAGGKMPAGRGGNMEGVCTGFAPGSSALNQDGTSNQVLQNNAPVVSLMNPDDPLGIHVLGEQPGVGMRRARMIEVWREGDELKLEVRFQDSGTNPEGGRTAIHEYVVHASGDADGGMIRSLTADPRVLPYRECPGAVANISRLVGTPFADLRRRVIAELPGTLGCTHLNDVLRSLADVPHLARQIEG